jgi:hypothetical protein
MKIRREGGEDHQGLRYLYRGQGDHEEKKNRRVQDQ